MRNRYGAGCARCHAWVGAGQGYLVGRSTVRHDRCPVSKRPIPEDRLARLRTALETIKGMENELKAHGGSGLFDEALERVLKTLGEIAREEEPQNATG